MPSTSVTTTIGHVREVARSAATGPGDVHATREGDIDSSSDDHPSASGVWLSRREGIFDIPGGQLLVVSAHHPSGDAIRYRIAAGQYRDVYVDVQGTPTPGGKFFVQDAQADGILSARPGTGAVDVVYENGVHRTMFNGDTKGQHLTDAEYDAKLAAADARYARMLTLLAAVEAIRP